MAPVPSRSSGLTFGVRLPNSGPFAEADAILRMGQAAAHAGYDMLWVHDHISWPQENLTHFATGSWEACTDQDPNFYESLTTLANLGGRFPTIGLGAVGLVMPLRDPRVLAKQAATISRLTDGRLTLAVAIGNVPADFETMDVPYRRRGRLTTEYLQALRAALGPEQPASFTGDTIAFKGTFHPRPERLPIWVAGSSDAGLERAATYGDGWMTVYVTPERYAELAGRLDLLVEERGRPRPVHGYETYVCVGRTGQEARDIARQSLEHKFGTLERGCEVCIVGDVGEVAARIDAYAEAGADHLELKFIGHEVPQLIEMAERLAARIC